MHFQAKNTFNRSRYHNSKHTPNLIEKLCRVWQVTFQFLSPILLIALLAPWVRLPSMDFWAETQPNSQVT
jgi:hypothetical protein